MEKIKKNYEFQKIYKLNKKIHTKYTIIFYKKDKIKKFGFVTSKKVGNAVKRNRIRRILKEIIRLNINEIKENQYIIVAKSTLKDIKISYNELEKDIINKIKGIK